MDLDHTVLIGEIRQAMKPRFTEEECPHGNHYFMPYNTSNLICMKCGRFAKIGYLRKEKDKDE